ncbi:MAG TPA: MaoC family dehydratase N-terminal domain-containing protein [Aestuariivirga sp.]|nr:MaoC family dehydratase N-terminal domain-containing protein [Aestuariivirga sp.]
MAENYQSWIGRSEARTDVVTPRLLAEYRATLGPFLFTPAQDDICPPGLHWGLAPVTRGMDQLGPDGSENRGLFLPPIPLTRRMWAGGLVESFAAIHLGMDVSRVATISDVKMREGKSGPLCFISVTHDITSGAKLLVRERQDLVFQDGRPKDSATPAPVETAQPDLMWTVETPAVLLFRFSAFTFNSHRVHYDFPYATEKEGYGGLLVQGPLQAALLLNQVATVRARVPERFEYRCMAPLIAGHAAIVTARRNEKGVTCRIADHKGTVTCEGTGFR